MRQKVNLRWQILATLLFPTGLYAFKRIKRLRDGIITYVAGMIIFAVLSTIPLIYWQINIGDVSKVSSDIVYSTYAILGYVSLSISIILPMIFIRKWSIEWNKNIMKESMTNI